MTVAYPGGNTNTYVASTEATQNMVVDFSRNPQSFAINNYVQIIPVTKDVGYYTSMTMEEAGRLLQPNASDHVWPDGEDAPDDRGQTESFQFVPYQTKRYFYGFRLGQKASQQASWDILAQHGRIKAQQAMTARTQMAVSLLTTSGNYPTGNTADVTTISGVTGRWDVSTSARQDIKRSIDYALDTIRRATLGGVMLDEFRLVMSPGCARKLAVVQEVTDYIKSTPTAIDYIRGKLGPQAQYGLPNELYGVPIVIEDAVKVTSRKGAAKTTSYVLGDSTPFLCSRPGLLVAPVDTQTAPRFATACCFMYEEMTVEGKYDPDNRVNKGRIVEDFVMAMTAGIAGFLFTNATA
jgi:hypothetical protein